MTIGIFSAIVVNLDYKLDQSNHNYETAQSELVQTKLENGNLLNEKQAYILTEEQLREELDISKQEMKELNRKLSSQAVYISKLEAEVQIKDTIEVPVKVIVKDSTCNNIDYKFNYNTDPWLKFQGEFNSIQQHLRLYDIFVPIPLTIGLTKDYSIFVTSDNPYVKVSDINAVALQDFVAKTSKRKHWGFGVYAGWGIQYDLLHNTLGTGPQIGVGVLYRF